jgi:hypothetical protein
VITTLPRPRHTLTPHHHYPRYQPHITTTTATTSVTTPSPSIYHHIIVRTSGPSNSHHPHITTTAITSVTIPSPPIYHHIIVRTHRPPNTLPTARRHYRHHIGHNYVTTHLPPHHRPDTLPNTVSTAHRHYPFTATPSFGHPDGTRHQPPRQPTALSYHRHLHCHHHANIIKLISPPRSPPICRQSLHTTATTTSPLRKS